MKYNVLINIHLSTFTWTRLPLFCAKFDGSTKWSWP